MPSALWMQCRAVRRHNFLKNIHLWQCGFGGNSRIFSEVLFACFNLEGALTLYDPTIQSKEISVIANFLSYIPQIIFLKMSGMTFSNHDAEMLAQALISNTNLYGLEIRGSNMTRKGKNAFAKAVFNDSDLNAVIDSNHTCEIIGIGKIPLNNVHNTSLRGRITRKKIHALFTNSTNSCVNAKAFHGIDSKLMPNVLAWIQAEDAEHTCNPLTRVFELMRGHMMPGLYAGKKSILTADA